MVKSKKMFLVFLFVVFICLTWLSIMPHKINADQIVAGCDACLTEGNTNCTKIDPEQACKAVHIICKQDGAKECFHKINKSCFGVNCAPAWDESCM